MGTPAHVIVLAIFRRQNVIQTMSRAYFMKQFHTSIVIQGANTFNIRCKTTTITTLEKGIYSKEVARILGKNSCPLGPHSDLCQHWTSLRVATTMERWGSTALLKIRYSVKRDSVKGGTRRESFNSQRQFDVCDQTQLI